MFEQKHQQLLQQDPLQPQQQALTPKENILHPGFPLGQQAPVLIPSPSGLKPRVNQHALPNDAAPFPREMVCLMIHTF